MIRVHRPEKAPRVLAEAGVAETQRNCELFDEDPDAYRSGGRKFDFDRAIYGHKTVKSLLRQAQHEKCCYCESLFQGTSYGAVEHYRPKGAVRDATAVHPGYYWLAYAWDNLLFSCERCNSSYKRSLFPLEDEEERACNHRDDVCGELPMFVDPSREDPREHIRFRGEQAFGVTLRGKATVSGLGLRREELREARMRALMLLGACREIVTIGEVQPDLVGEEKLNEARAFLSEAVQTGGPFRSMAWDFLNPEA